MPRIRKLAKATSAVVRNALSMALERHGNPDKRDRLPKLIEIPEVVQQPENCHSVYI
jgi:hypothetical protein